MTRTEAGTNCQTTLQCSDGQFVNLDWNVCYLNGRQFFTHPDLGDFSITYTRAGGIDGTSRSNSRFKVDLFIQG